MKRSLNFGRQKTSKGRQFGADGPDVDMCLVGAPLMAVLTPIFTSVLTPVLSGAGGVVQPPPQSAQNNIQQNNQQNNQNENQNDNNNDNDQDQDTNESEMSFDEFERRFPDKVYDSPAERLLRNWVKCQT